MSSLRDLLSATAAATVTMGGEAPPLAPVFEILNAFADAGSKVAREVRRAALSGKTGYAGGTNVTGDAQKKLDVLGNEIVLEALEKTRLVAAVVSEEDANPVRTQSPDAPYAVCTDPIDGSSNTDVDGPLGTIFSIAPRPSAGALPQGRELVAAGYVLYGPSTIIALAATGIPACAYTLDEERNAWVATHPRLRCPERGRTFSANLGRQREWHPNLRAYLEHVTDTDKATSRPYSLRYIGALVADLHRCLLEGGIYFYPGDPKNPDGKLRLLYECAPLAFLTESAGGRASDGTRRVLDVEAKAAHQRCPLVIGSAADVALYERFMKTGSAT
ncbi:MAG TPA: class 1 fructose-bisphosphatase [Candidatus Polarisedimenticolia bacterium]|nr:class 1 fructose-bisphosphatase [Candidatus Polarisedimenticolia bacterium]